VPDDAGRPGAEEALGVRADVVVEQGEYVVYLDVVLATGAVRRRIAAWPDERRARVAAREIERQAGRHIPAPPDPFGDTLEPGGDEGRPA
jgi:hypothetical protein